MNIVQEVNWYECERRTREETFGRVDIHDSNYGKIDGRLGKADPKSKTKSSGGRIQRFRNRSPCKKNTCQHSNRQTNELLVATPEYKKIDDCSIHFPRPVKNAGKKVSEDCHLLATSALKTIYVTQKNIHDASNEADEKMEHSIQNDTILQKIAESTSVSISNANSDSRSNETIETRAPLEIEKTNPIQPTLQNRNLSPSVENIGNNDIFQITKDCDFMNEHFKPRIKPLDAIDYLQQFVGKFRKIDFGFRVIE